MASFPYCWEPAACGRNGQVHEARESGAVLVGCYSRRKAVIMKNVNDCSSNRPYSHAMVTGIDYYP